RPWSSSARTSASRSPRPPCGCARSSWTPRSANASAPAPSARTETRGSANRCRRERAALLRGRAARFVRRLLLEGHGAGDVGGEAELVAVAQGGLHAARQALAVDEGAVGGALVAHPGGARRVQPHRRVAPRHVVELG